MSTLREAAQQALNLEYVGCYGDENQLGQDKEYGGGVYGANIALAVQFAREQSKRYLAIARVGVDGAWLFLSRRLPAPCVPARLCCYFVSTLLSSLNWDACGSQGTTSRFPSHRPGRSSQTLRAITRVQMAVNTNVAVPMQHAVTPSQ